MRGFQGAFVFETSDLAIKWPQWRFLLLDALVAVEMRVVCSQDVKNMLLKQSRMVGSKVRVSGVARRSMAGADPSFIVEGVWVQQRLYDIGWSDENKCQGFNKEEGSEKQRLYHCPCWKEVRNQIPAARMEKWEQQTKTSMQDWKWQRDITSYPVSESKWKEKPSDSAEVEV